MEFSHAEVNSYICVDNSNITPATENQKLYAKVIYIPGYSESMSNKADLVNGKVPANQLPSYVDDVLEYENFEDLPQPGETGKIYVITGDNDKQHNQYRWSGSQYTLITNQSILQLISDVDALTLTVTTNKTNIENALNDEASTRSTADITLQDNIDTLTTTVSNNKTAIENALSVEINNRTTADNTLQDNIDTLTTTVSNNKTAIENVLSVEINNRTTADETLQNNIDTLTTTVSTNKTAIENALSDEASTRSTADITLQDNIDTLTTTVSNNYSTLNNNISTEITNRTNADTLLQEQITNLTTTVSSNKTAIENALSVETNNRTTADETLQDNINTLSTTVINNKADLDDEIGNIQSDLNDNSTGIKVRLNQVEQHISLPDIYNNGKNISINGSTISLNDNLLDLYSIEISTQSTLKTSSDVTITKKDGSNHDVVIKLNDTNILLGTTSELSGTPYGNYLQVNIGIQNELTGLLAYAHGKGNKATGRYSVADGYKNIASADNAHAEGQTNTASGSHSHAEGELSEASGRASHAEGTSSKAIGQGSHAEGGSKATGVSAHAEGSQTEANGTCSHSEGQQTKTIGSSSHSEGYLTIAEGFVSHAEGVQTHSIGEGSHAEGTSTVTNGEGSHAEGFGTIATRPYQHVEGTFNETSNLYQHIVGGGNSDQNRKNIQTLDWYGNQWNVGKITAEQGFYEGIKKISTEEYVNTGLNLKVDKVEGYQLSKNDFTDVYKTKLDSIESNAEVNIIEDVKVDGLSLTVDSSDRSVNVDLSGKVDKVEGKGLSTEDYTTAEQTKLSGIETGAQVNIIESISVDNSVLTITNKSINIDLSGKVDKVNGKGLSTNDYTDAEQTKLNGIETGAQVNIIESISVDNSVLSITNKSVNIDLSNKADLVNGIVPANQLPSYVDDVIEGYIDLENNKFYSDSNKTEEVSVESGKIYIDLESNLQYRFGGSIFVIISPSLALGETADTAFPGNRGKALEDGKVDKINGKGLSTEDYTTAEQTKLSDIETGAQVNIIEDIKVNNTSLNISNKSVDITIPTKITDLINDSDFVTQEEGKGLSTEDYTTAEQTKLSGIETGAQVNIIESISIDDTPLTITNKSVNIDLSNKANVSDIPVNSDFTLADLSEKSYNSLTDKPIIPSKTSDLTNDSGFIRSNDIANIGLKNIPITSNNATTDDYSITWNNEVVTIIHNLNSRVIGALYNTDNEQIFIGINYINNNSISIDFSDIVLTNNDQFTLLLTAQQSVIGNVPTKVSDLTNDSNFVTSSQVSDMINGKLDAPSVGNCTNIRCLTQGTSVKIKWTDPSDLIIDNVTLAVWNSTVLVRKVGSYPTDVNDGTIITTSSVRNQYNNTAYIDTIPDSEVTYYYQLFSKTTQNVYNNNIENRFETSSLNWNTVHEIIQNGQAQNYFELGDVLTTNHEVYGEIQWQIVAFDQAETVDTSIQHSMTLMSLNSLGLRVFDCAESSEAPDDRNLNGYNKWSESNIRQWLNSNESANNWFIPQNEYDLCSYSGENGFMKGFTDSNFLNCLTTVKNTTALNIIDGNGGYEITEDVFWLPSVTEISGENNNGITEGTYWNEIFPNNNSRIKYDNNSATYWWLRSPRTNNAHNSLSVNPIGVIHIYSSASIYFGLVPVCVIS